MARARLRGSESAEPGTLLQERVGDSNGDEGDDEEGDLYVAFAVRQALCWHSSTLDAGLPSSSLVHRGEGAGLSSFCSFPSGVTGTRAQRVQGAAEPGFCPLSACFWCDACVS